jgi:hypothetical protein
VWVVGVVVTGEEWEVPEGVEEEALTSTQHWTTPRTTFVTQSRLPSTTLGNERIREREAARLGKRAGVRQRIVSACMQEFFKHISFIHSLARTSSKQKGSKADTKLTSLRASTWTVFILEFLSSLRLDITRRTRSIFFGSAASKSYRK